MNYLDRNAPPTRDERLGACCAFGGCNKNLVEGSKQGCLGSNGREFSQSSGCQLMLSLAIAATIPESIVVFHGPIGCGSCLLASPGISKLNQTARGNTDSLGQLWFSTNLSEIEVVSGGEAKLEETILEVNRRFRPQVIFVAATCVPAIIGDDIDQVVQKIENQVSASILPLHCAGFKTKIVATAYDVVYHSLLRHMQKKVNAEPALTFVDDVAKFAYDAKRKRTVNLLNVASMSRVDEVELVRLLNSLGLEVNILPCFAPPDRTVRAKDAAVSLSICATHDDYFVEHIKELYDVPYILNTIPIGNENTKKWLFEVADFFNVREQAERLVASEEAELNEALVPLRKRLAGKKVFISAGEIRAGATAVQLVQELGMEVVAVRAHHYDKFGDVLFETLPDDVPVNVASSQPFEQVNLLHRLKPDVYVGHTGGNVWAANQGIPVIPIFGPFNSYMGYKGTFELATRLDRVLRNPSYYNTLAKSQKSPYKKEWLNSDPFKYIHQAQAKLSAVSAAEKE